MPLLALSGARTPSQTGVNWSPLLTGTVQATQVASRWASELLSLEGREDKISGRPSWVSDPQNWMGGAAHPHVVQGGSCSVPVGDSIFCNLLVPP